MTVALSGTRLILGAFTTTSPDTTAFTPAAAPQGIVVGIVHGEVSTDLITGVTYGGVAMTRTDFAQDTSGEPGASYLYFLGASIPTGTQNVVITHTGTATVKQAWCRSLTAAADTQVAVSGVVEEPQANPQTALNSGAASSLRVSILYSGAGGIGSLTVLTGMEAFDSAGADANVHDFGNHLGVLGEQTTASTGSFTIGYTVVSVAVAMVAAAIQEVSAAATGTIAVTQDHQTAAISGTVANPITGTIAVTQSDQTAAFVGSLGISGTIASTQQDQTATFTGSATGADWDCGDWDPLDWATDCAPVGVIASIQDNQTAVFTGTVANPITGTIGVTQEHQTAAFLGTTVSDGVISSIQQDQTGAFTGTVANPISGTIGVTQANQTAAFSGTVTVPAVTGTIGVTQQDQIGAFIGQGVSPSVTGTIAVTQANQTMAAAGVVAMAVVGTIGVTQQNQTAAFAGAVANPSDTLVVSVSCTIGGPAATCTITPEMAVVGSDVYITTNYTNAAGQPANPASVAAVVEAPDGTQTTPTPTSITLGEWTTIIPTDQHGFWFFEITGEGDTVNVVCKGSFCVERSLVSV